jgi:BASS family bile acid:Na+ symporter
MDNLATVWLPLALAVVMFSLGLGLRMADFARVARRPLAFGVGVLAQMVAVPAIGYALVVLLGLPAELALGLMILAICPGGATSNILTKYAGGDVALSISLTGIINLASIATVPFLVAVFADRLLGIDAVAIDVTTLGISMFNVCAFPVLLGMMLRHYEPALADRIEGFMARVAHVLFAVVVVVALATNWPALAENITTLAPTLLAFNVAILVAGFALARLCRLGDAEAATIAIETGIQNTTMGIAVAALIAERAGGLPALGLASAVYSITMYLVCIPAVLLLRRAGMRRRSAA